MGVYPGPGSLQAWLSRNAFHSQGERSTGKTPLNSAALSRGTGRWSPRDRKMGQVELTPAQHCWTQQRGWGGSKAWSHLRASCGLVCVPPQLGCLRRDTRQLSSPLTAGPGSKPVEASWLWIQSKRNAKGHCCPSARDHQEPPVVKQVKASLPFRSRR